LRLLGVGEEDLFAIELKRRGAGKWVERKNVVDRQSCGKKEGVLKGCGESERK